MWYSIVATLLTVALIAAWTLASEHAEAKGWPITAASYRLLAGAAILVQIVRLAMP